MERESIFIRTGLADLSTQLSYLLQLRSLGQRTGTMGEWSPQPSSQYTASPPVDRNTEPLYLKDCQQSKALVHQATSSLQDFLEIIGEQGAKENIAPDFVTLSEWPTLYASSCNAPSITVRKHPSPSRHLYSVQSTMLGVTAKQFWALMANSLNRHLWDSTMEHAAVKKWLAADIERIPDRIWKSVTQKKSYQTLAQRLAVRVELLRFGSIMLVAGKRDMALVSVDTQLPSQDNCLRLLSTSVSVENDLDSIPRKRGYSRFQLNVGGFLVEDLPKSTGSPSIRVTQLSDLGHMAAWIPASIVKMVASSLVPRSISAIEAIAAGIRAPDVFNSNVSSNGYAGQNHEQTVSISHKGGIWSAERNLPPLLQNSDRILIKKLASRREKQISSTSITTDEPSVQPGHESLRVSEGPSVVQQTRESLTERKNEAIESSSATGNIPPLVDTLASQISLEKNERKAKENFSHSSSSKRVSQNITSTEDSSYERDSDHVIDANDESIDPQGISQYENGTSMSRSERTLIASAEDLSFHMTSSASSPDDLTTLLREALEDDVPVFTDQQRKERTQSWVDRSVKDHPNSIAAHRLSRLLVRGSDIVAMALAPGARDSMATVAALMDDEASPEIHNSFSTLSLVASGDSRSSKGYKGGNISSLVDSSLSLAWQSQSSFSDKAGRSSFSNLRIATPALTPMQADGQLSNPGISANSLQDNTVPQQTMPTDSLAWGIWNLASRVVHQSQNLQNEMPDDLQNTQVNEDSAGIGYSPAVSALRVLHERRNESRQDPKTDASKNKLRTATHYRLDDVKLHPFPEAFERQSLAQQENLPPVSHVDSMECGPRSNLFHEGSQRKRALAASSLKGRPVRTHLS